MDNILRVSFEETAEPEVDDTDLVSEAEAKLTIWDEVKICWERPLFIWSMLGYAAYSGGIIGFSTYGPQFVMGLGYFDEEFTVSILHKSTQQCVCVVVFSTSHIPMIFTHFFRHLSCLELPWLWLELLAR